MIFYIYGCSYEDIVGRINPILFMNKMELVNQVKLI